MALLINCPNCGERNVYDFRFGGEVQKRPVPDASNEVWMAYFYGRRNVAGPQREWWYHRFGCRKWFLAIRDTVSNTMQEVSWPESGER